MKKDNKVFATPFGIDGKINNSDYQTLNNVSKATSTRDLSELAEKFKLLVRSGDVGAGTNYELIGS